MKKGGFSLLEIVIALFITAAVFSAVVPLIFNTISANRSAKIKLNAYQSAQNEIELLKNQDITSMTNHSFIPSGVPNGSGNVTISNPQPDLASVNSRVSWVFRGKSEVIELKTYIYGEVN